MRRVLLPAAAIWLLSVSAGSAGAASSDPYCIGSYGDVALRAGAPLRFGIDPGLPAARAACNCPRRLTIQPRTWRR